VRSRASLAVAALVAAGVALRLTSLDVGSFWFDESCTEHIAASPDWLETIRGSRHPPVAILAVREWRSLFGASDAALRALPAIVSCVSLVLFARLATRWCEGLPRIGAVAIAATSPFLVWYAQELTPYAFVELGTLVALVGADAALDATSRRRAFGLVATALGVAIAMGSHYLGGLVAATVVALAGISFWREPARRRAAVAVATAAVVGVAVWIPWLVAIYPDQRRTAWGHNAKLGSRDLLELPIRLVLVKMEAVPDSLRFAGYALGALLLGGIAVTVARAIRLRDARDLRICAVLFVPIAVALASLLVLPPNFQAKYLISASAGAILAVAVGLASAPRPVGAALLALTAAGCLWVTALHKAANWRDDFRSACAAVSDRWRPGDRVLSVTGTPEGFNEAAIRHYLRARPEIDAAIGDTSAIVARPGEVYPAGTRVLAVYRKSFYAKRHLDKLQAAWKEREHVPFDEGIELYVFETG